MLNHHIGDGIGMAEGINKEEERRAHFAMDEGQKQEGNGPLDERATIVRSHIWP